MHVSVSARCLHIRTGTKFQACQPVTGEHKEQYHEILVGVAVYCSIT